jgi:anti-anti-sigma factor
MHVVGSSFFTVADRLTFAWGGTTNGPVVVWLTGEHDLSNEDALCMTLARAIGIDSAGLVLDLSEVAFMAVSTVGVIERAQEFLRHRSRSLTVRSPSKRARRVIELCRLDCLFDPEPVPVPVVRSIDLRTYAPRAELEARSG